MAFGVDANVAAVSSGIVAGALAATISYPIDVLKTRATANTTRGSNWVVELVEDVASWKGLKTLSRGKQVFRVNSYH